MVGEDWERQLEDYDGILVPGGFGKRGIEGMINAIRFARERKVPYFGICLGMQTMVIEYARNVCGLGARRFHRVRSRHAASRDLQAARAEGRGRTGRHDAAGSLALRAEPRTASRTGRTAAARSASGTATATSSIANTRNVLTAARPADHGRDAGRHVRRDLRDRGPSLVSRLPVPSGIQVQAAGAASAVQSVHRRRL